MRAGDLLRPLCDIGHDIDIDARGVRIEQRARLHDRIDLLPDLLLDRDLFEHRLDHDIALPDVVETGNRLDAGEAPFHLVLRQAAALDAGLVIGADARHAAL